MHILVDQLQRIVAVFVTLCSLTPLLTLFDALMLKFRALLSAFYALLFERHALSTQRHPTLFHRYLMPSHHHPTLSYRCFRRPVSPHRTKTY